MLGLALLRQGKRLCQPASIKNITLVSSEPTSLRLLPPLPLRTLRKISLPSFCSLPCPRIYPNFHSPNPLTWGELLRCGRVNASRTKWERVVRDRILNPSRRSWSQVMKNSSSFRGYRGYSLAGLGGRDVLVVWVLIGANLVVFGLWQFADRRFMMDNFMVSVNSLMSGRIHTLVTSAFSQVEFSHLLPNMLGLYFFGTEIAEMFGGRWLLNLYLAGAVAGSMGHICYSAFVVPWLEGIPQSRWNARYTPSALGASGAVNAIVLLHILLFPTRIIMVNLFIPVPAALFGAYLIGSDVWQARNEGSRTAHAGHLGGALVGAIAWLHVRRRWR